MPVSSGSKLGPYEVLSLLGAGGMGEVYRVRDPRLGREVAIKMIRSDSEPDPDGVAASRTRPARRAP
jgi:eukaryotic-like serine/threonine-protein kinase